MPSEVRAHHNPCLHPAALVFAVCFRFGSRQSWLERGSDHGDWPEQRCHRAGCRFPQRRCSVSSRFSRVLTNSQLFLSPPFCLADGSVKISRAKVQLSFPVQFAKQVNRDPFPCAVPLPLTQSPPAGNAAAIPFWRNISPPATRREGVEDAIERGAVVCAASAKLFRGWKEITEKLPFRIGQIGGETTKLLMYHICGIARGLDSGNPAYILPRNNRFETASV